MKLKVNTDIAFTHILTRKKQTFVAAMGVTIGLALYIFSSSLMNGFANYSKKEIFKSTPHIKIFKEDQISEPLAEKWEDRPLMIANPKITTYSKTLINPLGILERIRQEKYVKQAAPQVNMDVFYNNGDSQLKGVANGVMIEQANAMFAIEGTMEAGDLNVLQTDLDAIVIGTRIAEKLHVGIGDRLTVTSSRGGSKVLRVAGIFSSGNKAVDESKSYVHLATAQQLARQGPDFITDLYVNISDPDSSLFYAEKLQAIVPYKVEDWQTSNADMLAQDRVRITMNSSVTLAIMMIAAFGIYNILNMTVMQKMNDIAILKATGFARRDIIRIFVTEAFIMGMLGTIIGILLGATLIELLSRVYIGPPIGYFPVEYSLTTFAVATVFGLCVSIGAGYFPAKKAANVDPVEIFRK